CTCCPITISFCFCFGSFLNIITISPNNRVIKKSVFLCYQIENNTIVILPVLCCNWYYFALLMSFRAFCYPYIRAILCVSVCLCHFFLVLVDGLKIICLLRQVYFLITFFHIPCLHTLQ